MPEGQQTDEVGGVDWNVDSILDSDAGDDDGDDDEWAAAFDELDENGSTNGGDGKEL